MLTHFPAAPDYSIMLKAGRSCLFSLLYPCTCCDHAVTKYMAISHCCLCNPFPQMLEQREMTDACSWLSWDTDQLDYVLFFCTSIYDAFEHLLQSKMTCKYFFKWHSAYLHFLAHSFVFKFIDLSVLVYYSTLSNQGTRIVSTILILLYLY